MTVETSSKILKIFGILSIIGGILGIILGILALLGGGLVATDDAETGGLVIVAGIVLIVSAIVSLIEGIFAVRAAKDHSKINPAWVLALISLIMGAISAVVSLSNGGSVTSSIPSILFSILVFVAANNIKKAVQNPGINNTPEA